MTAPSIATRMYSAERDIARHELELVDHDHRLNTVERTVAVAVARIGFIAAGGSILGGAIVAAAIQLLFHYHHS